MPRLRSPFPLLILVILCSCNPKKQESNSSNPDRPNILWLVAEDLGPYLPAFGDSTIATPNLSRLAAEGVRYTHVFSPSGVCAPSRAAIATGMYPSGIGANHMRTGSYTEETGLPAYEAVPPPAVKMFSELMRKDGYYCSNNPKTDYQFKHPVTAWDESSREAHWRNRKEGEPFFSIFNFGVTHESGLFEPYNADRPRIISKETEFKVPPYLPDNEVGQRDMWKLYNNIAIMDRQIGEVLDQLEEDGLLENTIIFFYGDHGGPLPRQKRLLYDAGLRVPMIVRYPDKMKAGTIDDQLISFIDFAPTVLEMAGQVLPDYLDGQTFLNDEKRKYIHAAGDRFDAHTDVIRAVRDQRFKYIRNYRPDQGYYLPIAYRERIPTMQELLRLRDAGALNEVQAQWFREQKPREELFDCENDPHELVNLADDPTYAEKLSELSQEMDRWLEAIGDEPNLPERALIDQLWQGADQQPITADPVISAAEGRVSISCSTAGASIGYRLPGDKSWHVYIEPFEAKAGMNLEVQAHRIGYKASETVTYLHQSK